MKQSEFLPRVLALFLFLFHFPYRDLQSPLDSERITLYCKRRKTSTVRVIYYLIKVKSPFIRGGMV